MSQKFKFSLLLKLGFFVSYYFFAIQATYANEIPAFSSQYTSEIKLNGVAIEGKHPIVQNRDGSIFFPAKELWIGAYLSPEWDKQNKIITFSQVGTKLTIDINKKTLQINGRLRQLEPSDAVVYKDYILVSDRLMALIFKMEIKFDAGQQVLNITTRKPTPRDFLLAEIRRSKANARANKEIEESIINANGEYLQWSTTQADTAYVWEETTASKNAKKAAGAEKLEQKPLLVQAPVVKPEPTPPPVKKIEPVTAKIVGTTKPGEAQPAQYSKSIELVAKPTPVTSIKVPATPLNKVEINTEVQQKIDKKPEASELASAISKAIADKTPADSKASTPTAANANDKKADPKKEEKKTEPQKVEPIDANYVAAIKYNGTTIDDFHEVYQKKSGRVFYPADVVLQTAEATVEGNSQRLVLTAENLQMKLIIDSDAKTLTINNETRPLTEEDAFITNETVLVSDELMSKVFQFDTKFSPATQELYIRSRRPMPRDLRLAREKRWDRLDAPGELTTPLIVQDDKYVLFGNPQTDVSLTWDRNPEGKQSANYNVNVVSELAGLTQQLLLSGGLDNALNAATWRAGRTSGRGQVFGIEKLYDVAMGDVSGLRTPLVGDAGSGRGIRYQYAPLGRATNFDKTVIEGSAQPGWDAELYFAGNLVDFQKVSKEGRYLFKNVPLNYGDNNIRVVLYGPQGQTQDQVFREQIGGNMVPVGEIYSSGYILQSDKPVFDLSARNAAAKAAASNTPAKTTSNADGRDPFSLDTETSTTNPTKESFLIMGSRVDYGLSNRLTVGLFAAKSIYTPQNAVAFDDNLKPIVAGSELDTYYGLELRPSLGQYALETGLTARSGGGQAAYLRFAIPIFGTTLSVTHDHYGLKYLSKDNGNGSLASRSTLGVAIPLGAPGSELGAINLGLDLGMQRNETNLLKSSIGYGHRIGTVFFNHQIDVQTKDTPGADLSHSGMYRLKATYRQDFWDVRGELRADLFGQGIQSISVAGQYRPDEFNSLNANLTLSPNGVYSIGAGVSKNFSYGNVAFNVGYGDKKWSVAAAVSFSLGYTGSRGLNITSRQRSTMGMADIHIYEDVDADGVFTEGVDKPIPEAGITLNQQAVEGKATDKNGMLGLDELPVFSPSVVAVGLGQVSDGFLVPMYPRIQMWPRPGNAIKVNYPLTEAGEIAGYLRMQVPPITAVGPKVELTTMSDKDNKKDKTEDSSKTKDVAKQNPVNTEQTKTTSTDKTAVDTKIAVPPSAVKTGTAQTTAVELSNRPADPKASGASFVGGKTILVNGVRERTLSTMRLQIYRPDGKLHGEVRSLSDGYFIFDTVYPGKWTLKVAPNQIYYGTPLEPVEQVVELTSDARTKNDILIFYKSDGVYDATRSAQKTPEKPTEKDKSKETENSKATLENKNKDGNNDNKQIPEKKSE
jgi:hypothetical protein